MDYVRIRMRIAAVLITFQACAALGARIDGIAGAQGPGLGSADITGAIDTFAEGLDDATESTVFNFWSYSVTFTSIAPVDFLINVVDPSNLGISEYAFEALHVNHTGIKWTGFKMQLGFGSFDPSNFAIDNFIQSSDIDRLDFDRVELNDNSPGRTPVPIYFGIGLPESGHASNALTWSDVVIGSPGNAPATYHVDIPGSANIPSTTSSDYQFTLRLTPIAAISAPEPGTYAMYMLGLWVWSSRRRSVRRA